tara:strand:+ start:791 stop:955 length:165 start_codon:yes stop_codon:yes gene_type:complete
MRFIIDSCIARYRTAIEDIADRTNDINSIIVNDITLPPYKDKNWIWTLGALTPH